MKNYYSVEEKNYVKENWGKMSCNDIASNLNRKPNSVRAMASKLNVTSPNFWNKSEITLLKEIYFEKSPKELEKMFNRKMAYITHKANELGIRKQDHLQWSKEEHNKLKNLYPTTPNNDLSAIFNRSPQAVKRYAHKHNFGRKRPSYSSVKKWEEWEISYLKETYGTTSMMSMKKHLNRSGFSIQNKANKLGLSREISKLELAFEDFLKSENVQYIRQHKIWKYRADFYIPDHNLIIETYGDFWHCNPTLYNEPVYKVQKNNIAKDKLRISYIKSKGYKVLIAWEYDFYNNFEDVKKQLRVVLSGDV
jgi:very-short-patch-repair endonuclease